MKIEKTERMEERKRSAAKHLRPIALRALALVASIVFVLMPARAQQQMTKAQESESLFERIERAVKEKEPDWKLAVKDERRGAEQKYFAHDWTMGEEYVSTTTYQLTDTPAAVKSIADFIRLPIEAPVQRREVQGLGDEAYSIGESPYGRKGAGTIIVRRVNIMIRLDASSLETAKRFAKYMLDAVDAVCGGALCQPMK